MNRFRLIRKTVLSLSEFVPPRSLIPVEFFINEHEMSPRAGSRLRVVIVADHISF
jgi:hypothetical protein